MKVTKLQLKQIIKEEITKVMSADNMVFAEQCPTSSDDPHKRDDEKEALDEEQLNEIAPLLAAAGPIVMQALKMPAVQQALMSMLGPMLQKAMGGGEEAAGAAARAPAGSAAPGTTGTME